MVGAGWGVSRGGGDNCGALVGAGAFRNVPGGPAYGGGAASVKIGPSETIVSPDMAPQHSVPLPLRQQRRPNHGRSGQQKQQPQANSRLPAKIIDIQRARTMRWVPLSGKNGPNRPGDSSRKPGLDVEPRMEDRGWKIEKNRFRRSIFNLRFSILGLQGPTPSGRNPRHNHAPGT
jgi:hypothetical protein